MKSSKRNVIEIKLCTTYATDQSLALITRRTENCDNGEEYYSGIALKLLKT